MTQNIEPAHDVPPPESVDPFVFGETVEWDLQPNLRRADG